MTFGQPLARRRASRLARPRRTHSRRPGSGARTPNLVSLALQQKRRLSTTPKATRGSEGEQQSPGADGTDKIEK